MDFIYIGLEWSYYIYLATLLAGIVFGIRKGLRPLLLKVHGWALTVLFFFMLISLFYDLFIFNP